MQNHITTFDTSVFEVVNGQINLTKICQFFNKRLNVWLKTKQTKAFLALFSAYTEWWYHCKHWKQWAKNKELLETGKLP
jgi:hypothetical protein